MFWTSAHCFLPLWLLIKMICKETKITLSYGEVQVTEGNITVNVWRKPKGNRLWFKLVRGSSHRESTYWRLQTFRWGEGEGGSLRPWDNRGSSLKTKIFWPLGPQFGLIIRGGHGPSPGSTTATVLYSRKQVKYSLWHRWKLPSG